MKLITRSLLPVSPILNSNHFCDKMYRYQKQKRLRVGVQGLKYENEHLHNVNRLHEAGFQQNSTHTEVNRLPVKGVNRLLHNLVNHGLQFSHQLAALLWCDLHCIQGEEQPVLVQLHACVACHGVRLGGCCV